MIRAAIEEFAPDMLIVDKVPRGVLRELDPMLRSLRAARHTRCVLGLRDVLDDPAAVRAEWLDEANEQAIDEFYDAVWVYGDPKVYDVVEEYGFAHTTAEKLQYTGYLDPQIRQQPDGASWSCDAAPNARAGRRLAICLVGGGEDGARVAGAFARSRLPSDMDGVIIAGPFMPPELYRSLCRTVALNPPLRVVRFMDEPEHLVRRADRVVAMAGYNTVCEVLCLGKPALVVPRVRPRREQWIRAIRLRTLGLLDVMHPDELRPGPLSDWLARESPPTPPATSLIDFNGLARIACLLNSLSADAFGVNANRQPGPVRRISPHPREAAEAALPHKWGRESFLGHSIAISTALLAKKDSRPLLR
jgi:predicted glycosyltransferase